MPFLSVTQAKCMRTTKIYRYVFRLSLSGEFDILFGDIKLSVILFLSII